MAVSRPLLLALVGVVLLGATFFAWQNSRNTASESSSAPAEAVPAPSGGAEPVAELTPKQSLESAFTTDFDSGRFDARAEFSAGGESGSLRVSGAVDNSGKEPEADVTLELEGLGQNFEGGFVTTDGEAFFTEGDSAYQVPEAIWKNLSASPAGAQGTAPQGAAPAAGPLTAIPFSPAKWVKDVKSEGTESVEGVETEHVSASLDAGAMVADLAGFAQAQSGPAAVALPPGAVDQVTKSVKRADFDVWVAKEDKGLRRLTADVAFEAPGAGPVELSLDVTLSEVGKAQQIDPPENASQQLPSGEFGGLVRTLLEGSTTLTGGDPSLVRAGLQATDNPKKLRAALREGRKVALFFANPRGLDDQLVVSSMRAVDRRTGALALTDLVVNVDRYGDLLEDLGVNQTPAVVVIDSRGQARLVEGYIDPASLVQVVADAR